MRLFLVIAMLALMILAGCATLSDVDKAALHNAHVGAVILRTVSAPVGSQPSYESAQDGLTGTLGRLDLKFNGPVIATSTALLAIQTDE